MNGSKVGVNLHNLVVVTLMVAVGMLLANLASRTPLGQVPLVGPGLAIIGGRGTV